MNYLDQLDAHQQPLIWSNYTVWFRRNRFSSNWYGMNLPFKLSFLQCVSQDFWTIISFALIRNTLSIIRPFGSPKEPWQPWLTSLETVASSCGKKDHGCLWCFSVPPIQEVQQKGRQMEAPQKGIYATDVRAEISLNHDALHQFFSGAWSHCNKDNSSPQTKHWCSQVKRKWDLCISLSPWKVFRSLFSYIAHFK